VSGNASRREISKVVTESRGQLVKVRIKQICGHECDAVTRLQNIRAHKNHTCTPRFIKLELVHQGGKQHKCADRRIKRFESFSSYKLNTTTVG